MTAHGTAATEQPRTAKRANRGRRRANRATTGGSSGSDGYESHQDDAVVEYHYRHPKRRVITAALFLWERVAAFSAPAQVAELERVSRDVARHLAESNTGTHLLQRYWNAQWSRMVWKDEELPEEKRYLAPAMLTRSDGKRSWKKVFVEEYPLYLERIYQGKGVRNNDMNEAKVLFHREVLNTAKTAKELQRLELTEEEARVKELRKRGVDVEVDETPGGAASPASPTGTHAVQTSKAEREKHEKGRPRAVAKAPHESYTRSDYKEDYRTGDRKGKHKKGGTGRWSNFDDFGDYSY
ncbi:hypothetical protein NESM_000515300 [Novymonas esmeraldas]|uniref:Uncharacterized protein n=1 Tax=Novymonas esmeraldas TaxID=1808958 RepID=A0AAW0ERQ7_9TRYP